MNEIKLDFHRHVPHFRLLFLGRCRLGAVLPGRPADRTEGSSCRDAESCFLVILSDGEVGQILDIFEIGLAVCNFWIFETNPFSELIFI